eukprot:4859791-Lingulodinium_polyedra.AAC.1
MECKPLHVDGEVAALHRAGRLGLLFGKHVDGIKTVNELSAIKESLALLEKTFGKLEIPWSVYATGRIRCVQDTTTFRI